MLSTILRPRPSARLRPREVFAAIDFETADSRRDSACQVAVVRVKDGAITEKKSLLIRPPRQKFEFTYIHGLRWEDVADAPTFAEAWPQVSPLLEGVSTLYAHNASFDRSVLESCCAAAGLRPPVVQWGCSVRLARATWGLSQHRLPDICALLNIELKHHDAASDAEACARIVLAARAMGW